MISNHLHQVVKDESRHAALAWRSLKWLIDSAPEDERQALDSQVAQTFYESAQAYQVLRTRVMSTQDSNPSLNHYGVLSQKQVRAVRIQAFYEVILPALEHAGWAEYILKEIKHIA